MITRVRSLVLPFLCLTASSCATTVEVTRGSMVPAAQAEAKAKLDDNGNAVVDLKVERLAQPEHLTPPQRAYHVWAQTAQGKTHALGQLRVDEDGEATFHATVAAKNFRLVVSAEAGDQAEQPSAIVVLSTSYVSL